MEHYLANITHYITNHPQIGLICALLIAFAESLPIVGTIIPGSVTMTAIGILIGQNALPLVNTLLLAVVGALVGDIIGYWLGKHYQNRIHKVWPFKRYPKMLGMGRDFFKLAALSLVGNLIRNQSGFFSRGASFSILIGMRESLSLPRAFCCGSYLMVFADLPVFMVKRLRE